MSSKRQDICIFSESIDFLIYFTYERWTNDICFSEMLSWILIFFRSCRRSETVNGAAVFGGGAVRRDLPLILRVVPGLAVGFFTNLFGSRFNVEDMYFGFVNIVVAIAAAFFANKGYYEKFSKVLITIPFIIFMTSFFGTLIRESLMPMNAFNSLEQVQDHFLSNFFTEFPDKSFAILLTFFLLKITPPDLKESFRVFGKM